MRKLIYVGLLAVAACAKEESPTLQDHRKVVLKAELGQSIDAFDKANAKATLSAIAPPITFGVSYSDLAGLSITSGPKQSPLVFPSIRLLGSAVPNFELEPRGAPEEPLKGTLKSVYYRPAYSNNNVADTLAAIAGFLITVRSRSDCILVKEDQSSMGPIELLNLSAPATISRFNDALTHANRGLSLSATYKCENLRAGLGVIDRQQTKGFDVTYSFSPDSRDAENAQP